MKTNLFFTPPLFLAAALFAAVGCSDEESYVADQPAAQGETVQPAFRAELGRDEGKTKTTLTHEEGGFRVEWRGADKFPSDCDLIGIVVTAADSYAPITGAANIPYRPALSAAVSPLEAVNAAVEGLTRGAAYDFYAYYPYNASQPYLANLDVAAPDTRSQTQAAPDDLSHLAALDALLGIKKGVVIPEEGVPQVGFAFGHRNAILQFSIANGRSEALMVKQIKLATADGTAGISWASEFSLLAITNGGGANLSNQRLTIGSPVALSGSASQRFWMAIRHQTFIGGKLLAIEVTTDKGTYRIEKSAPAEGFLGGCNYTLDLTIPQTADPAKGETWTDL